MLFKRKRKQHKTQLYPKKQGKNSHKAPLQPLAPNNEELYPKTLEMVDYLNQKPRPYIINLHLVNAQNGSEPISFLVQKTKADTFLPAFNLSFCLNGEFKNYAFSIRLFGPNKKIMFSSNAPISSVQELTSKQELTPKFYNNQYSVFDFSFTSKEKIEAIPGMWVCLAQLQKIVKWNNNHNYEAEIIAEKEFEFPIIEEEK